MTQDILVMRDWEYTVKIHHTPALIGEKEEAMPNVWPRVTESIPLDFFVAGSNYGNVRPPFEHKALFDSFAQVVGEYRVWIPVVGGDFLS
ncbi:hypothetical protein RRG08_023850 [Elysia crispata]|uniref:Uncharacterized protein n=1 Tax=Elysia crispata TaxID=231223 RepID=A0AAE1E4B5_9GAST|nr:hypothetical protein RRG08_023850 [Elysia crispata]